MVVNIKEYRGVSGIYKIEHIPTGKVYIGSAVDIGARWTLHLSQLKKGCHHSRYLQRAWNKYGEDAFSFMLMEFVEDIENLLSVEQIWIDIYESYNPQKGYNICPIAGNALGRMHTKETREKMSAAKRNVPRRPLSSETKEKISIALQGVKYSLERIYKSAESNARDWIILSPEGAQFEIHNLRKFCRDNNLNAGAMVQVAKGKKNQYKRWRCKYKNL